ncbi:MAG TPA: DMT family transporter [Solirubrobacteraceae bacterium]|nr:DMT family transporter [Solirubrobacteraceae bacterium]
MTAVAPAVSPAEPEPESGLGRRRAVVVAAVGTMVCLWASAFVAIRFADRELSPGALALGRLLVGSAALGALVVARRAPLPGRRQLAGIVVCGVLWFGLYNVALNAAETRVDAGTAAMLVNIGPILIAILAGSILHEGFPPRLLAGCLVSFAGAVVIGLATSHHGLHVSLGAVLCLVAAAAYAGGVVAQKPVLRHASPLSVTWLACTIGMVGCLPYAGSLVHGIGHASAPTIGWMIYLGVAPTAAGFVLWAYALARTTAGRMGSTTYLVPPLAILFGWAFLGEVPPLLVFPGGALCLAGVALARTRGRSRSPLQ